MIKKNDLSIQSDKTISALKDYFRKRDFLLVYLFGSQVGGNIGPLSDFDIAILTSETNEPELLYIFVHDISNILDTKRIDVVSLNNAPLELQYRIIRQGHLLYKKNDYFRVEFEANTLSRYFDFLLILIRQRDEILMEGKHERGIQRNRKAFGKTLRMLEQIGASTKTSR